MKAESYKKRAYGEWFHWVPFREAKRAHAENVRRCREAVEYHKRKDRPLNILAVHGSGRSSFSSCAQELSNSQMLLGAALEQFRRDSRYEVKDVRLRDYTIEPCNCCYSTTSALCGFPCDCFPLDPMQELYPLVLKCDVLLISTGVNQSAMASRLKLFCDRLISLDGGFYRAPDQVVPKDPSFRDKCVALSLRLAEEGKLPYDARMWGRSAAYFITSKDEQNRERTATRNFRPPLSYVELVAWSLRDGFADYGFFHHPREWYAGAAANPDEELSLDKAHYERREDDRARAERVARLAVELGEELRRHPPRFDGGARRNRT